MSLHRELLLGAPAVGPCSTDDLIGLFSSQGRYCGAGPEQIVRTLAETLGSRLALDLLYVRLSPTADNEAVELVEAAPWTALRGQAHEAGAALCRVLGDDPVTWPLRTRGRVAGCDLALATLRLGAAGELGVLVAASARPEFADDMELLLLNVAANQAVIAWQSRRLLGIEDSKRAESQLAGEKALLEMIASGRPFGEVLAAICRFFEDVSVGCNCGIYPIDWGTSTFECGVAPSLPASYTNPIAGLPVSREVAPCGIAAFEKSQVIAEDIDSDPRWQGTSYRAHVLEHGLRAVWSTPICSQDGRVLGTFCIYQRSPGVPSSHHQRLISHVTHIASIAIERSRAEALLTRSEAFLAEGQRLSSTGSFAWRLDTGEITFSDELYRIFEFEKDVPVTFERIRERVHAEDLPLLTGKTDPARAGVSDQNYDLRLLMPDGRLKYLRRVARAVPHHPGRSEQLGTIQDVTERRLAEDALANVRSELAQVTRIMSLGVLTASIAHEVNQPLSGIITNANTCQRMLAATPPNVGGALETVRRTLRDGQRASEVVARLRSLFRKKGVVMEAIDLNEATREVIALSGQDLQRRRISLQAELDGQLPSVRGDRVQLQQVILNLLLNASDAMDAVDDRPKRIFVRTAREKDGAARVTVQDSGIGVMPESLDKLFDAFYTTKTDGMGIGLSVSRSIIESHHGRLWFEPNDGPGATFAFAIPQARSG
jgi:signal transduction histidine kinase